MSLHKREDCPYVCPIEFCQKKFSIHAILLRHMAKVHKGQSKASSIQCDLCPMVFHHDLLLKDHVKKNHQIIDEIRAWAEAEIGRPEVPVVGADKHAYVDMTKRAGFVKVYYLFF